MFIVENYPLAVVFCIITMLCWGSWANTQKLAGKPWRFELFYWDYVIGIFIFSLLSAFTLGSIGSQGRSFMDDLQQADASNSFSALVGGFIFIAANSLFSAGIFLSNFIFNTILMKKPLHGSPTGYKEYFKGSFGVHMVGVLGGLIWGLGNSFNLIAAGKAGPAISYGLGQGATLIAALWGVFIWKEFQQAPKGTNASLTAMFIFFIAGLALLIYAGI